MCECYWLVKSGNHPGWHWSPVVPSSVQQDLLCWYTVSLINPGCRLLSTNRRAESRCCGAKGLKQRVQAEMTAWGVRQWAIQLCMLLGLLIWHDCLQYQLTRLSDPGCSFQLYANMLIMVVLSYWEILFFCFKKIKAQIHSKSSALCLHMASLHEMMHPSSCSTVAQPTMVQTQGWSR